LQAYPPCLLAMKMPNPPSSSHRTRSRLQLHIAREALAQFRRAATC
jgi:hypothetical protein